MKKQRTPLIIFFPLLLIIFQTVFADTTATDELAVLMDNIRTMQATFIQSLVNQSGARIGTKTTGKMAVARPGKFRWEITKPHDQLIIINNNKMISYDPDLSQITNRKVNVNQPGNPAMLLSSPVESLKQSFQIIKLKKSDEKLWFKLTPKKTKGQASGYQWIKIGFIDNKLNAMYIFDNLDQTSLISFSNIEQNAEISPKNFTFTPPPNSEVFDAQ